jgi:polar amino acid transport system substrate-binding protein
MACLGAIALVASGLTLAASQPVVIGTDAPFPAYTYVDAEGTITGFERDVMDEVCARSRMDCTWQQSNFDTLIPGVMTGQFDIVLGGMAVTEARQRLVDFSVSYHVTDPTEWYIGRPGAPPPGAGMVAVQSGTVHEAHLKALGYPHAVFPTEPEVLEALRSGAATLALGPFETRADIAKFVEANGLDFLYSDLIPDNGVAMAVCKGNTDLLDSLNAALEGMRADGTLQALETRWFE